MNRICTCGWMLVFSLVICSGVFAGGTAEPEEPVQETTTTEAATEAESESLYPPYLALVDGLHVTGRPVTVDIATYRLSVSGASRFTLTRGRFTIGSCSIQLSIQSRRSRIRSGIRTT